MPTVPALMALVIRSARLMSLVQTVAARPYWVSLAIRTASSSSLNGITDSTGPKISSRAMLMSLVTSVNSVGATKLPAARGLALGDQPEHPVQLPGVDQRGRGDRGVERAAVADHPADHLGRGEEL